ncbi:MAG: hypothetical protein JO279_15940 [Verrucomicrobia bacterium]|nr:hypothetical protein [Verrucomicrobiota bacterium]
MHDDWRRACLSETSGSHSDTLVLYGATGDLAYKKIFPALHARTKRGHLGVPAIGVADWNLDQLKARARESIEKHGGSILQPSTNCAAYCAGLHARQLDARIEVHLSKYSTHGGQFAGIDFPNIQLIGAVVGAQRYALLVGSVKNFPQQHCLIAFQVSVE